MLILTHSFFGPSYDRGLPGHECGLFSIICRKPNKAFSAILRQATLKGLRLGSNRGRDGFGLAAITTSSSGKPDFFKYAASTWVANIGTLAEKIDFPKDPMGYQGHIRYATMGSMGHENAQPMLNDPEGKLPPARCFSFAFNGHIVNAPAIRKMLEKEGRFSFKTDTDTEVLMQLIAYFDQQIEQERGHGGANSTEPADYAEIYKRVDALIEGGCSATHHSLLGDIVAYRHGEGKRPLSLIRTLDGYLAFASETNQFEGLQGEIYDIQPGTIIHYNPCLDVTNVNHGDTNYNNDPALSSHRVGEARQKFDPLEILYFMESTSKLGGHYIDTIRQDIGAAMYKQERVKIIELLKRAKETGKKVIIAPVPNTAVPFAEGFMRQALEDLGFVRDMEQVSAIVRTNTGRSFLGVDKKDREAISDAKYQMRTAVVENNILIAIDDSAIRQTTINTTTRKAFAAGAAEVHHMVVSPAVKGVETSGIAIPSYDQLGWWKAAMQLDDTFRKRLANGERSPELDEKIIEQMRKDSAGAQGARPADSISFLNLQEMLGAIPRDLGGVSSSVFEGYPKSYDSPAQQSYAQEQWEQNLVPDLVPG